VGCILVLAHEMDRRGLHCMIRKVETSIPKQTLKAQARSRTGLAKI
jgi:hypothetical protein